MIAVNDAPRAVSASAKRRTRKQYLITLHPEFVEKLDGIAFEQGTDRSKMIERALARQYPELKPLIKRAPRSKREGAAL